MLKIFYCWGIDFQTFGDPLIQEIDVMKVVYKRNKAIKKQSDFSDYIKGNLRTRWQQQKMTLGDFELFSSLGINNDISFRLF